MIKKVMNIILYSRFIKSMLLMASGSALAQIISLLCSPIISRLYTTEQLGYYTYITSITNIFACVVCLRYDVAIVKSETENENKNLIQLSAILSFGISILVTIGAYLYIYIFSSEVESIAHLIIFVFPILMTYSLKIILTGQSNYKKDYQLITKVYIVRIAVQEAIMVIGGLVYPNALFLLIGQIVGQVSCFSYQYKKLFDKNMEWRDVRKRDIKGAFRKYRNQALYSTPATMINALSYSALSISIAEIYGASALGLYSYSFRMLGVPLTMFSENLAKIHYVESLDEIKKRGNFFSSTKKALVISGVISVLMTAFLMLFAPSLFAFVFGEEWREAGEYVRILAPFFGVRLLSGSIGNTAVISSKQKSEMLVSVLLLIWTVIGTAIAKTSALVISNYLTVISIGNGLIYLAFIIMMVRYSRATLDTQNQKIGQHTQEDE